MCLESLILKRPLAPNLVAPWVRAAWTFLTGGLLLGSYWAYYELGWGGFWFWDPVENAALMPWLVMTAFLHTLFNPFQARASLGLGVLAFCLCVCILFFVRSGVLVSVHSFAVDANRGLLFFILTLSVIVPSLMIFSKNIRCVPKPTVAKTLQFFMFQTQLVLLMVGVFILFLAMLIPIIMGYFGNPFSLGPSYFQATFLPMLMPLLFFMVFSPFLGSLSSLLRQPVPLVMLLVSFILSQITLHYYPLSFLAFLGFWFALSILGASIFSKQKLKRLSMHMAHGGVALVLVGAILGTFGEEKITFSLENSPIYFCGYTLTCQSPLSCHGPNYTAQQFPILVTKEKKTFGYLGPEIRHYPTQEATHHESSLLNQGPSQLYAVCSMDDSGKVYIQVLYKPYINFLWVGGLLLMVSGIFSWFGQSLRQSRFFFRRHTSC
jgi:c-type cytochrome biogenesis protein CcmF